MNERASRVATPEDMANWTYAGQRVPYKFHTEPADRGRVRITVDTGARTEVIYRDTIDPHEQFQRDRFIRGFADACRDKGYEALQNEDVNCKLYQIAEQAEATIELPEPINIHDLIARHPRLRSPIIDGLLRRGETANIIAASKIGKSWLSYSLALSVATGSPWFGRFGCASGRVLIVDNELHPETIAYRIQAVANAMGIEPGQYQPELDIIPLRGRLVDLNSLGGIFDRMEAGRYSLVIGDAWYRFIPPGVSENDNAQVMGLFNRLDNYVSQLDASWVGIHHASKGTQADKRVTDVGSGAGSQSRAADTHIVLREHEQDNVVVMEAALRSFAPMDPLPLRWNYPLWTPADDVDPSALKRQGTQADANQAARDREGKKDILQALQFDSLTRRQLRTELGMGPDRINRLVRQLVEDGEIGEGEQGKLSVLIGGGL